MSDGAANPEALSDRLRQGDSEALAALFAQDRDRLLRMIKFRMDPRLLGRVDAEDVLQEAYLAASQRLRHFGGDSSMSPFVWLRIIVMQTLTDVHRHHLGAQMRDAYREAAFPAFQYPQASSASLAALLIGQLTSPSQVVAREEMLNRVEQAITSMDRVDREVLALRHFEELSNTEVAEVLGIQQKAASIRYIRAVKRLRGVLSQIPGFLEDSPDA